MKLFPGLRRRSIRRMAVVTLLSTCSTLFQSCDEELPLPPPELEEETVPFQRISTLVWRGADSGKLEVIGDRMYFSNIHTPGYFDKELVQHQYVVEDYDMRFGHVFTKEFSLGVFGNRRSLVLFPNTQFYEDYKIYLNALNIPELPADFLLQPGPTEKASFGINGNYVLSSWEKSLGAGLDDPHESVFILELNANGYSSSGDLVVDKAQPVLRKIPLDFAVDKTSTRIERLLSVFPFGEGWLASVEAGGLRYTVEVRRDGAAVPLAKQFDRYMLYSAVRDKNGGLFVTHQEGLFYSSSGSPFELRQIAEFSQAARIKLIDDRMVVWIEGETLWELKDYLDGTKMSLAQLEHKGLEGLKVKDVALFEGMAFVATNGGLFFKEEADFWKEVNTEEDLSAELGWKLTY